MQAYGRGRGEGRLDEIMVSSGLHNSTLNMHTTQS